MASTVDAWGSSLDHSIEFVCRTGFTHEIMGALCTGAAWPSNARFNTPRFTLHSSTRRRYALQSPARAVLQQKYLAEARTQRIAEFSETIRQRNASHTVHQASVQAILAAVLADPGADVGTHTLAFSGAVDPGQARAKPRQAAGSQASASKKPAVTKPAFSNLSRRRRAQPASPGMPSKQPASTTHATARARRTAQPAKPAGAAPSSSTVQQQLQHMQARRRAAVAEKAKARGMAHQQAAVQQARASARRQAPSPHTKASQLEQRRLSQVLRQRVAHGKAERHSSASTVSSKLPKQHAAAQRVFQPRQAPDASLGGSSHSVASEGGASQRSSARHDFVQQYLDHAEQVSSGRASPRSPVSTDWHAAQPAAPRRHGSVGRSSRAESASPEASPVLRAGASAAGMPGPRAPAQHGAAAGSPPGSALPRKPASTWQIAAGDSTTLMPTTTSVPGLASPALASSLSTGSSAPGTLQSRLEEGPGTPGLAAAPAPPASASPHMEMMRVFDNLQERIAELDEELERADEQEDAATALSPALRSADSSSHVSPVSDAVSDHGSMQRAPLSALHAAAQAVSTGQHASTAPSSSAWAVPPVSPPASYSSGTPQRSSLLPARMQQQAKLSIAELYAHNIAREAAAADAAATAAVPYHADAAVDDMHRELDSELREEAGARPGPASPGRPPLPSDAALMYYEAVLDQGTRLGSGRVDQASPSAAATDEQVMPGPGLQLPEVECSQELQEAGTSDAHAEEHMPQLSVSTSSDEERAAAREQDSVILRAQDRGTAGVIERDVQAARQYATSVGKRDADAMLQQLRAELAALEALHDADVEVEQVKAARALVAAEHESAATVALMHARAAQAGIMTEALEANASAAAVLEQRTAAVTGELETAYAEQVEMLAQEARAAADAVEAARRVHGGVQTEPVQHAEAGVMADAQLHAAHERVDRQYAGGHAMPSYAAAGVQADLPVENTHAVQTSAAELSPARGGRAAPASASVPDTSTSTYVDDSTVQAAATAIAARASAVLTGMGGAAGRTSGANAALLRQVARTSQRAGALPGAQRGHPQASVADTYSMDSFGGYSSGFDSTMSSAGGKPAREPGAAVSGPASPGWDTRHPAAALQASADLSIEQAAEIGGSYTPEAAVQDSVSVAGTEGSAEEYTLADTLATAVSAQDTDAGTSQPMAEVSSVAGAAALAGADRSVTWAAPRADAVPSPGGEVPDESRIAHVDSTYGASSFEVSGYTAATAAASASAAESSAYSADFERSADAGGAQAAARAPVSPVQRSEALPEPGSLGHVAADLALLAPTRADTDEIAQYEQYVQMLTARADKEVQLLRMKRAAARTTARRQLRQAGNDEAAQQAVVRRFEQVSSDLQEREAAVAVAMLHEARAFSRQLRGEPSSVDEESIATALADSSQLGAARQAAAAAPAAHAVVAEMVELLRGMLGVLPAAAAAAAAAAPAAVAPAPAQLQTAPASSTEQAQPELVSSPLHATGKGASLQRSASNFSATYSVEFEEEETVDELADSAVAAVQVLSDDSVPMARDIASAPSDGEGSESAADAGAARSEQPTQPDATLQAMPAASAPVSPLIPPPRVASPERLGEEAVVEDDTYEYDCSSEGESEGQPAVEQLSPAAQPAAEAPPTSPAASEHSGTGESCALAEDSVAMAVSLEVPAAALAPQESAPTPEQERLLAEAPASPAPAPAAVSPGAAASSAVAILLEQEVAAATLSALQLIEAEPAARMQLPSLQRPSAAEAGAELSPCASPASEAGLPQPASALGSDQELEGEPQRLAHAEQPAAPALAEPAALSAEQEAAAVAGAYVAQWQEMELCAAIANAINLVDSQPAPALDLPALATPTPRTPKPELLVAPQTPPPGPREGAARSPASARGSPSSAGSHSPRVAEAVFSPQMATALAARTAEMSNSLSPTSLDESDSFEASGDASDDDLYEGFFTGGYGQPGDAAGAAGQPQQAQPAQGAQDTEPDTQQGLLQQADAAVGAALNVKVQWTGQSRRYVQEVLHAIDESAPEMQAATPDTPLPVELYLKLERRRGEAAAAAGTVVPERVNIRHKLMFDAANEWLVAAQRAGRYRQFLLRQGIPVQAARQAQHLAAWAMSEREALEQLLVHAAKTIVADQGGPETAHMATSFEASAASAAERLARLDVALYQPKWTLQHPDLQSKADELVDEVTDSILTELLSDTARAVQALDRASAP